MEPRHSTGAGIARPPPPLPVPRPDLRTSPPSASPPPPLQERIRSLIDDRKFLVDDNWAPGDIKGVARRRATDDPEASAMVEKERARLEVLKRRQEKDMQQVGRGWGGRK